MPKEFFREAYIRIGRNLFEFDKKLHVQKVKNGYLFGEYFYPTFDELALALTADLKYYFEKE
jgi:hypothetical protein